MKPDQCSMGEAPIAIYVDGEYMWEAVDVRCGWTQRGGQPRVDIMTLRAHYEGELGANETERSAAERDTEGATGPEGAGNRG